MNARGIERDLAGIDQFKGATIDVQTVMADKTRVIHIDPLRGAVINAPGGVGDHEGASLANGNDGRTNFYFNGHSSSSILWNRFVYPTTPGLECIEKIRNTQLL